MTAPLLEDGSGTATTVLDSSDIPELENALLVGLQVTQVQVCTTTQSVDVTDPFGGDRHVSHAVRDQRT